MSVLLLNASWEPLRVVPTRRAISLVIAGKAELLEHGDGFLRSANDEFPVPVVVRLNYMVRVPFQAAAPFSRRALRARDEGRCQFAGCKRSGTTVEHLLPRSRGGATDWENCVLACERCNAAKGNRTLAEVGWRLKRPARAPRGAVALLAAAGVPAREEWLPYLPAA